VRQMEGDVLRLADSGDEVLLVDRMGRSWTRTFGRLVVRRRGWTGRAAERMAGGSCRSCPDGSGGWIDRDSADDWEGLRHHRLGQSAFDPGPMELRGASTAVLSPDAGDIPLLRLLGSARATIEVGVYTFQSERIGSVLGGGRTRCTVRVLLDGSPVGASKMMSTASWAVCWQPGSRSDGS